MEFNGLVLDQEHSYHPPHLAQLPLPFSSQSVALDKPSFQGDSSIQKALLWERPQVAQAQF